MPIDDKKIADAIGQLYEGAVKTTSEGWDESYRRLSSLFSAGPGSLHFFVKSEGVFAPIADTNEPGFIDDLNSSLFPIAPFREDILKLSSGEVFLLTSRFPDGTFRNTPFYNEHFRKNEIFHVLHVCLIESPTTTAGITFTRPESMNDFSREEIAAVRELIPHLQRAVRLHIDVVSKNDRDQMLTVVLDKLPQAVVVADHTGKIVYRNFSAERFFGTDGVFAVEMGGGLACRTVGETNELRAIIASVFKPDVMRGRAYGGVLNLLTRHSKRPISVLVSPFEESFGIPGDKKKYALLMLSDPTGEIPALNEDLKAIFDLTNKEAVIAIRLAEGKSIAEIAAELGTSPETIRTHLKHVFSKVGTNRQASLVRYILSAVSARR